jgi:hypothetical protein
MCAGSHKFRSSCTPSYVQSPALRTAHTYPQHPHKLPSAVIRPLSSLSNHERDVPRIVSHLDNSKVSHHHSFHFPLRPLSTTCTLNHALSTIRCASHRTYRASIKVVSSNVDWHHDHPTTATTCPHHQPFSAQSTYPSTAATARGCTLTSTTLSMHPHAEPLTCIHALSLLLSLSHIPTTATPPHDPCDPPNAGAHVQRLNATMKFVSWNVWSAVVISCQVACAQV